MYMYIYILCIPHDYRQLSLFVISTAFSFYMCDHMSIAYLYSCGCGVDLGICLLYKYRNNWLTLIKLKVEVAGVNILCIRVMRGNSQDLDLGIKTAPVYKVLLL